MPRGGHPCGFPLGSDGRSLVGRSGGKTFEQLKPRAPIGVAHLVHEFTHNIFPKPAQRFDRRLSASVHVFGIEAVAAIFDLDDKRVGVAPDRYLKAAFIGISVFHRVGKPFAHGNFNVGQRLT